jgi:serine/threonine protein kinase
MGCLPSKPHTKKHHLAENFIVPRQKHVTDDYCILKQIGRGSIGKIFLAEAKQPDYYYNEDAVAAGDHSSVHTSNGSKALPTDCDICQGSVLLHDSSTRSSRRKRQYAIKEIDACCMIDVRAFDSLKTEIMVLRKLDHPYIIKFFGSYSMVVGDCESLSVVMELCTGGSLDQGAPYEEATVKILVANIAEAVLYMHNHRVIHRDLKVHYHCQDGGRTPLCSVTRKQLPTHRILCPAHRTRMLCSPMKARTPTTFGCSISDWPRSFRNDIPCTTELGPSMQ